MAVDSEQALFGCIDRIYESIEQPELWPQTIYAIGEILGGRRHFWGIDHGAQAPEVNSTRNTHSLEIGCHGTFFLSRSDLQALDQHAQEFGGLIVRFLKIVFLSILRSQNDVGAREAIGLRIAQRYLQAFESLEGTSASSLSRAAAGDVIVTSEPGQLLHIDKPGASAQCPLHPQ